MLREQSYAKNNESTLPFLPCFILYMRAVSKYKPPGTYTRRGDLTEGFLLCEFVGLIFGRVYRLHGGFIFGILRSIASKIVTITFRRGNNV